MSSDNGVPSDNAYEALSEGGDDVRWAYGTGFADPLEGTVLEGDLIDGKLTEEGPAQSRIRELLNA